MTKYLFGLGGMVVGAGLMFIFMEGEVKAEVTPEPFVCSEAVESVFQGEAVHNLWHCQIANMSCGLSAKGISCEKKGLIEKILRGVESIFKSIKTSKEPR
jgi:hypothetical protein